jgi:hypothetical protein
MFHQAHATLGPAAREYVGTVIGRELPDPGPPTA